MTYQFRRSYTGPVKAIVVDLAGTVIDFGSCAPAGAFVRLFEKHGITATEAQAREPMGMHKREHIRRMLEMPAIASQWEETQGKTWTDTDLDRLYEEFIPMQLACLPDFSALIPGVVDTVKALRTQDIKIAATTGYNHEMMEVVLGKAGEQGLEPDAAFCGSDVPMGRPAPWLIYRSMEALNVYPPEAVIKIGDTIADIDAGLNAGVWSVGVAETGNMMGLGAAALEALPVDERQARLKKAREAMQRAGAHYVLDSFSEIIALVQHINTRLALGEKP